MKNTMHAFVLLMSLSTTSFAITHSDNRDFFEQAYSAKQQDEYQADSMSEYDIGQDPYSNYTVDQESKSYPGNDDYLDESHSLSLESGNFDIESSDAYLEGLDPYYDMDGNMHSDEAAERNFQDYYSKLYSNEPEPPQEQFNVQSKKQINMIKSKKAGNESNNNTNKKVLAQQSDVVGKKPATNREQRSRN